MTIDTQMKTGDALLIIDPQNDFCPGGALAIEEGDKIMPIINNWIHKASDHNITIYASRDWHPKKHVSFQDEGGKWPPHCIQDSNGALFHKDLALPNEAVIVTKGVRFDKDQNSIFDETGLDIYLKRKGIERLFICGLALDVCVLETVMDALRLGFQVWLILDGTRPVNETDGIEAVEKMKQAGVTVIGQDVAAKQAIITDTDQPDDRMAGQTTGQTTDQTTSRPPDQQTDQSIEPPVCTKAPEWAEHQRSDDEDEPCDDGRSGKIHQ